MKKAVIFARVSSEGERQSTTRQVEDLKEYASKNNLEVENIYEEHISGAKKNNERPILNECLSFCVENNIDILLLSELSRLGRCADEVLANVRFAKEQHLNIYFQKENIFIYDKDGKENPFLTIMIAVLSQPVQASSVRTFTTAFNQVEHNMSRETLLLPVRVVLGEKSDTENLQRRNWKSIRKTSNS